MKRTVRPTAGQNWRAETYAAHARFVTEKGMWLVEALAAQPGEHILDLGCGDGVLTQLISDTGAKASGLEASPELARAARRRGVTVIESDAHDLDRTQAFDAVISNAALHWMHRPAHVIDRVFNALKPGGRFIAEQGGFGNVAAICAAVMAALEAAGHAGLAKIPWDFPTADIQAKRLHAAGFRIVMISLTPQPTPLPTGLDSWLQTFAGPFVDGLPEPEKQSIRSDAARRLKPLLCDEHGNWTADYVRLRFHAIRPH